MKAASIKKVLILVTILAVPGFLYYVLKEQGKNRYKSLPYFGVKKVGVTFHSKHGKLIADTIYYKIGNFSLVNQNRDTVDWKSFSGKILIFNVFYTTGKTNALIVANDAMKTLDSTYAHNNALNFVSISMDPTHDQPEVLSKYAAQIPTRSPKWTLLTGDSTEVFKLINEGLSIDAHQSYGKQPVFLYSSLFVLVDPQHHIRGYYDAGSPEAMSKLNDEIKVLLAEVLRNTNDGR